MSVCEMIIKECEQNVQAQCMLWYATRPSKFRASTSSLVYLLCMLSCLLHASFHSLFVMLQFISFVLIALLVAIVFM